MKKWIALLLVFVLSFCLVACGSDDVTDEPTKETNSTTESTEEIEDELSEEELQQAYQTLMSCSILSGEYKQLANAGVYRDVSYGDIISYTFSKDAEVTYSKYDEDTVVLEVSGPYRYSLTDDSFAYSGMIQLYIHQSGKVMTRSDPNGIMSYMRTMATELASMG